MGCNCKQQPQDIGPRVITVNKVQEFITEPTFTQEELDRATNWLTSTNKTKEETEFVYELNRQHFGENIQGYCDISCQHRIRRRIENLQEKLNKWKKDQ